MKRRRFTQDFKRSVVEQLLSETAGPAELGGILPNDVIEEVDGIKIRKFEDLKKIVDYSKVGDTLSMKVYRNGKYQTIPVRLRKRL